MTVDPLGPLAYLGEGFAAWITLRVEAHRFHQTITHDVLAMLRERAPSGTLPMEPSTGLSVLEAWWQIVDATRLEMFLRVSADGPPDRDLLSRFLDDVLNICAEVGVPIPESIVLDTPALAAPTTSPAASGQSAETDSSPDIDSSPAFDPSQRAATLVADLRVEHSAQGQPGDALLATQQHIATALGGPSCRVLQDEGPSVLVECSAQADVVTEALTAFVSGMPEADAVRVRCRLFPAQIH